MRGRRLLSIFMIVAMMLSLFLFYQEEAEALTVDYIVLTDTPNGTAFSTVTLPYGASISIWASGYNNTGPTFADLVMVDWSESGGLGSFDNITGTTTTFTAGFTSGMTTIKGQNTTMGVNDTFDVNILPPTLDYIVITNAPDGNPLNTVTLPIDGTVTAYTSGYNLTGPTYIDLIEVGWSGPGGSWAPTTGTSSVFTAGTTSGFYTQTAQNTTLGVSDTFDVIIQPSIDYIILTDSPDGTPLTTVALPYGGSIIAWASGYNNSGPTFVDLVMVGWSESGGLGSFDNTSGTKTTFTADFTSGLTTITGENITMGVSDSFDVNITPPTIDYIVITDAANGIPFSTVTLPVDGMVTAYASGYNFTGPIYVDLVEVDWSGAGGSWAPTTGANSVFTAGMTPGLYIQTGQNSTSGVNDTFYVNIQPSVDYIILTDAPDGNELFNVTLPISGSITIYASGYNYTGPTYVELVEVDWSQIPTLGSFTNVTGTATTFTAISAGSLMITGENITMVVSDDFDVNITDSTIDYIRIRSAPGGGGIDLSEPGNFPTYPLGAEDTYWGAMYNFSAGYVGDVPPGSSWSSDYVTIVTVTTPGTSTFVQCSNSTEGIALITLNDGSGHSCYTIVNVSSGPVDDVDYIQIRDAPGGGGNVVTDRSYNVSDYDYFWAAGYNFSTGYVGDVNVMWSCSNESVGNVTPKASSHYTSFMAVGEGTCYVEADYGGGITNMTGTLTVSAYDVDYIIIRDSPYGAGSPVDDMLYREYEFDTFYAAGYNFSEGYLNDVNVTWNSSDESVGSFGSPNYGTSKTFQAGGQGGTCFATADYGGGITDDTGTLTVAKIDSIVIRDEQNNGGLEVGSKFFYVSQSDIFWAASYNVTYGYIGDIDNIGNYDVNWSSSNESVATVTSPGAYTNFTTAGAGTCVVTVNCSGITDETGIITVSGLTIDYVQIRDAPGGGGDVVIDPSYTRGSVDTYWGALYNFSVGFVCDAPSDSQWESSDPTVVSVTSPGESTNITCNETNAGTSVISLWIPGFGNYSMNSTTVTVLNWTVDYISIMDAPGGTGNAIGDKIYIVWENDIFYAVGMNYTAGYVKNVMAVWTSDDTNVGTVTSPGTSSLFTAQWTASDSTCQVSANYSGLINTTGILTVLTPRTDYVQIRSAAEGGGAVITSISYHKEDTDTYYGASYNHTVGYFGSVPESSIWESMDTSIAEVTSPGDFSDITCSDTNWGTVNVTLNDGLGHTNFTTVTVLNWTVDYILVRDSPGGGGLSLSDPANYPSFPVGHITTFYGAMYNYTAGYVGDVSSISTWASDNTNLVIASSPGVSSIITCSNTNWGTAIITLEDSMGNTATTEVTVLEPTVDYITIVSGPNGTGYAVGNVVYIVGDTDVFYASAFNNTANYLYDISVDWSSSDTSVGTVNPSSGYSTNFTAEWKGTCIVTADFEGGISDSTGILTVNLPSNLTVDISGGALFTSIQEAINNANDGDTVYVYSGTYYEHLTIDKSITLTGENKDTTIIDGENYGKVIHVMADNVSIGGFTIQNGEYGIYCHESDSTYITYNHIKDYDYGIYCHLTVDGYIARNTITYGQYGIVTFEAYNDAIRYNTISYNTEYGAKDYNSQLKNCFNWNYFHHNNVAYYYDPDTPLSTLEFDGNILEDNHIAIKVENGSTVSLTNNTASRNDYGIYLINASPKIDNNSISKSNFGIYAEQSSPTISNNTITESSEYSIYVESGDSLKIINNTVTDSEMIFIDSTIEELWLKGSNITKINTTIENSHIDETSSLVVRWFVNIVVIDDQGMPVEGATVLIYDARDTLVSSHTTDSYGWIAGIPVIESLQNSTSTMIYNPYLIRVLKDSQTSTTTLTIEDDDTFAVYLQSEAPIIKPPSYAFPWALIFLIGFIGAIGVGGIAIEVMKFGLLSLFLPLYTRIKKEKMLDQPTRERIYGYIIGNPGAYFGLIKEELDLGSGQLVHHLKQLTNAHLIYSRVDGVKKRFYPVGISKSKGGIPHFSNIQEKILGIIKNNSGIGQKKIAASMGISRQVAGYHLTKMERKGLIEKEVIGKESRYYPSEEFSV